MKVLLVAEYYYPHIGGIEVVVENLAKGLLKAGHEVCIITCRLPETSKYEERDGVEIFRVSVPRFGGRYLFNFLGIPLGLKLAGWSDIVHTTGENVIILGWLVSILCRKKKVVTIHEPLGGMWTNVGMGYLSAKLHQLAERLLISLPFDKYICVSRYTRNCLRLFGIRDEKLEIIYNGIDSELFDPNKKRNSDIRKELNLSNEFVYIYYGRPGLTKGVEYLIQAVSLIAKRISNSKLVLILSDDPKEKYNTIIKMIEDLEVEEKIILLKSQPRNELPDYIATADCVVVPSISEGFGFSAAEACAMEKPIVASDAGSLPEVVSGEFVLVPPRDPEAIAEGVQMIHNNLVKETDKKIFSWDRCLNDYLKVYQETMNDNKN